MSCLINKYDNDSAGNSTASITRSSTSTVDIETGDNEFDDFTVNFNADEEDELINVELEIPSASSELVPQIEAHSIYHSVESLLARSSEDRVSLSAYLKWGFELMDELSEQKCDLEAAKTSFATCAKKLELAENDLLEAQKDQEKEQVVKMNVAILSSQLATTTTNLTDITTKARALTDEVKEARCEAEETKVELMITRKKMDTAERIFTKEAAKRRQLEKENQQLREDLEHSDSINCALTELHENTSVWLEEEIETNISLEKRIGMSSREDALHHECTKQSDQTDASSSKHFNIINALQFCLVLAVMYFPMSLQSTDNNSMLSTNVRIFDDLLENAKSERRRQWSPNEELIPMIME